MLTAALPVAALLFAAARVHAAVTPITPGSGAVYNEGAACTVAWEADTTGAWTMMNIDLMTGSNDDTVFLKNVALFIDGTDPAQATYSYPCPDVTPNSAIYFYRLSTASGSAAAWTPRFAIASRTGATTPPPARTQPGGEPVPWGTGAVTVNGAAASYAPPLPLSPIAYVSANASYTTVSLAPGWTTVPVPPGAFGTASGGAGAGGTQEATVTQSARRETGTGAAGVGAGTSVLEASSGAAAAAPSADGPSASAGANAAANAAPGAMGIDRRVVCAVAAALVFAGAL
ncbi:hypothetical protein AcW2_005305 [Taiwanofungus camphoratus]|nr:hypothetical protein AcW2_005305 [Antrodia cinnamomea]